MIKNLVDDIETLCLDFNGNILVDGDVIQGLIKSVKLHDNEPNVIEVESFILDDKDKHVELTDQVKATERTFYRFKKVNP